MPVSTKRRYQLVLPEELFAEVESLAEQKGASVVEVLRRFIKLGLLVAKAEESPTTRFVIREGESEREIVLLM
jgi:hypothetical protein